MMTFFDFPLFQEVEGTQINQGVIANEHNLFFFWQNLQ